MIALSASHWPLCSLPHGCKPVHTLAFVFPVGKGIVCMCTEQTQMLTGREYTKQYGKR